MRISTNTIFQQGITSMQRQQADLVKTQQQLSTGNRILTPADDPVAAARVLQLEQASGINEQYATNRGTANSALGQEEGVLQSITTLLQDVRTTAVYAGNPTLTNSDRAILATELESRFRELLGLSNSTDGTGLYLFSGYQGNTQPYSGTIGSVTYSGDQGQRLVQVGATRQMPVSDAGSELFDRIRTGNGTFLATANAANTGAGIVTPGAVVDTTALTSYTYEIQFTVAAGVTTYDVVDTTNSTTVSTGNAYTAGSAITVAGMQVTIDGAPANGDKFSLAPSSSQSMFDTIGDLINAVRTPATGAAGSARLANSLNVALSNLDLALDRVSSVRADVGARMQELDSLDSLGSDLSLQYDKTISQLKDVDYASAVSDLARQQLLLQAAQQTFAKVTGMSLFDFL